MFVKKKSSSYFFRSIYLFSFGCAGCLLLSFFLCEYRLSLVAVSGVGAALHCGVRLLVMLASLLGSTVSRHTGSVVVS